VKNERNAARHERHRRRGPQKPRIPRDVPVARRIESQRFAASIVYERLRGSCDGTSCRAVFVTGRRSPSRRPAQRRHRNARPGNATPQPGPLLLPNPVSMPAGALSAIRRVSAGDFILNRRIRLLSLLPLAGEVGAKRRMRASSVRRRKSVPHPRLRRGLFRRRERRTICLIVRLRAMPRAACVRRGTALPRSSP
jgi:hypothetical protein